MTWTELSVEDVEKTVCVDAWLVDVGTRRTGSQRTREGYLRRLTQYCNYRQMKPDELLKEGDIVADGKKRTTLAEQNLLKYVFYLERDMKRSRGTVKTIYGIVRSFFRSNEILFYGKTPSGTSRARSVSMPKANLIRVVNAADLNEKYAICGLASTGMRPTDFGALTYGDVKVDYEAGKDRLYVEKMSQKEDLWFGVFLSRQTTKFLRLIIEQRKRNGEQITDETVLLREQGESTDAVSAQRVLKLVKNAGARTGMYLTPKLFRKNFRTLASPEIGRDSVSSMAAWTIPGAGKSYFLPGKDKALEQYQKIEHMFTYEEIRDEQKMQLLARLEAMKIEAQRAGVSPDEMKTVFRTKRAVRDQIAILEKLTAERHKAHKEGGPVGGGLPFQIQAQKALADIIFGAIKEVKRKVEEDEN